MNAASDGKAEIRHRRSESFCAELPRRRLVAHPAVRDRVQQLELRPLVRVNGSRSHEGAFPVRDERTQEQRDELHLFEVLAHRGHRADLRGRSHVMSLDFASGGVTRAFRCRRLRRLSCSSAASTIPLDSSGTSFGRSSISTSHVRSRQVPRPRPESGSGEGVAPESPEQAFENRSAGLEIPVRDKLARAVRAVADQHKADIVVQLAGEEHAPGGETLPRARSVHAAPRYRRSFHAPPALPEFSYASQ